MARKHCTIEGCEGPHVAKGMCKLHYYRVYYTGQTSRGKQSRFEGMSDREVFEANTPERGDGCWEWQGNRCQNGYGRVDRGKAGVIKAHRLSFKLHNGYLPEAVCHRCDNPPCVNPAHLFAGTYADNVYDMVAKGRQRGPYRHRLVTAP